MRSENLCEAFIFGALAPPTARPSLDNIMTLSSVHCSQSVPARAVPPRALNCLRAAWREAVDIAHRFLHLH